MFWAETFERLNGLTAGYVERILVSLLIVASVIGVRLLVGRWRSDEGDVSSRVRLLLSSSVALATALGVLALIGVWGLGEELLASVQALAIGNQLANVVLGVIVLGSAYVITDFLGQVIRELVADQKSINKHQEEVVRRTMQLSVYSLAALVVIGLFTDNVGGLLVGAGFLGIVVGMAARQTIGAMLAGFVLMFSRPFEIGNWVEIGDYEGTVSEITIINTRLHSFDGDYITIPNDEVRSKAVVDHSWRDRLRIEVEIGVDYDSDPKRAAEVAVEAIEGLDAILDAPEPAVVAKRFDDSAVVLGVRYWIAGPSSRKRWETQTQVMSRVKDAFEEAGIKIPYPHRELKTRDEADGLDVTVGESAESGRLLAGDTGAARTTDAEATSEGRRTTEVAAESGNGRSIDRDDGRGDASTSDDRPPTANDRAEADGDAIDDDADPAGSSNDGAGT